MWAIGKYYPEKLTIRITYTPSSTCPPRTPFILNFIIFFIYSKFALNLQAFYAMMFLVYNTLTLGGFTC